MQVYKFGGASIQDAESIKNVANIIRDTASNDLLVVISAMGKTTNALEELSNKYFLQEDDVFKLLGEIKNYHFQVINELFGGSPSPVYDDINNTFVEIEWMIEDEPQDPFSFIYDQIVSIGELLSSKIVSHYLNFVGLQNKFLDARSYIQTDNTYREAKVNWKKTCQLIKGEIPSILKNQIAVTQGFIGNTSENFTTTLGREGSDYSAAIFANCLDAEKVTIWKDVPGILNADPKLFAETTKFQKLSYAEAIEMTYYGANVLHPKTIKPLQNKNIPLLVKPFLAPTEDGTTIEEENIIVNTPIIIVKKNQILLSINSKDFSFISEKHLRDLFKAFTENLVRINMMQISALSFSVCFDYDETKFNNLSAQISENFTFRFNQNLDLITIRHANQETIDKYIDMSKVVLEQRSRATVQFVVFS